MRKIIIHAGLHKTGTSAIQQFMHINRKELVSHNIFYPNTHSFEAHHNLAARLRDATLTLEDLIKDANRTIGSFCNMYESGTIVISSEMFSEGVDPRVFRYISELADEVQIIFYIRRQDELLESAYNQQVKQNAETRTIDSYKPYFTNIYEHVNWFERSIPGSRISVNVYDRKILVNNDVIDDFCSKVLSINSEHYKKPGKTVNTSLSAPGCLLMRIINQLCKDSQQRSNIMKEVFEALPHKKFKNYKLLSDAFEKGLLSKESDSNKLLDQYYLHSNYMEELKVRSKDYITEQLALDIANDAGLLGLISKKYGLEVIA